MEQGGSRERAVDGRPGLSVHSVAACGTTREAVYWLVPNSFLSILNSYLTILIALGILVDDGIVKPLPPITRALQQTREALEAAGHVIIEFHM